MKPQQRMHMFLIAISYCLAGSSRLSADEVLAKLLVDDFEQGMSHWRTTDPRQPYWEIRKLNTSGKPNHVLRVLGKSNYQPPHRSPKSIALLKEIVVSDFELTVRVQSTNPSAGGGRDMCLFWGYQDPSHFYYVHLGGEASPTHCQIFIVNDAPRKRITTKQAKGTPWTEGWHVVRIARRVTEGTVAVYFDDMTNPLMSADDNEFAWGQVGLGTFDDHGNWDDFQLRGTLVDPDRRPALK